MTGKLESNLLNDAELATTEQVRQSLAFEPTFYGSSAIWSVFHNFYIQLYNCPKPSHDMNIRS